MEEQNITKNSWVAYTLYAEKSSWGQILASALGWWLSPFILIIAKLLNKTIQFGIWEHGKFKALFLCTSLKDAITFQKESSITDNETIK